MTEEERDNGLEKIFRNKLEENELVAGSDLTGRFMRRLERREFFRFNPARFNIWYITAAAAGLIAGIMLLSGSPRTEAADLSPRHDLPVNMAASETYKTRGNTSLASEPEAVASTDKRDSTGTEGSLNNAAEAILRYEAIIAPESPGTEKIVLNEPGPSRLAVAAPMVMAVIEPSVTSGCVPLHVHFGSNAGNGSTASWSFGDGGTSTDTNPDYIYDIPGTYLVILRLTDRRGRTTTATTMIEAIDNPRAAFEIRQNESFGDSEKVLFANLSEGAVTYLWDFGDGTFSTLDNPSYKYERPGSYDVRLFAYSASGCADSVTVNDVFTDKGLYLRFPSAFVPGTGGPTGGYYSRRTDEANQVFHPVAAGVSTYNLKIYSKAGMLVFESDDIAMGWDGYYKGELCSPGVYVWKVRATYRNGQSIILAGDVTLISY